jgi:diguanylate cyclase (GGDEF)-like protein
MPERIRDARVRELELLGRMERGAVAFEAKHHADPVLKSLAVHLLAEGYANGLDSLHVQIGDVTGPYRDVGGKSALLMKHEQRLWETLGYLLAGQSVYLHISHKGRVRRSELEQALRTGRDRDSFGVLWDARHRDQGVTMAVLSAERDSPVAVAYLDMNGLKEINDAHDHAAGDTAIRTYLQAISTLMGDKAEGFRGGSSDEVVVVLRDTSAESARDTMRAVLKQLAKERVIIDGNVIVPFLTASCGVVVTIESATDARALVQRADAEQVRAKKASKEGPGPRASFLAIEGREIEKVN